MINQQENGQKQGFWVERDGANQWSGYYENGRKDGSWSYYADHSLLKTVRYLQDSKQGPGFKFGREGNLLLAVVFDKDRIHGKVRFFAFDGQHIATYVYVYDKLDRVEFYLLHDESPSKDKTYLPEF